MFTLGSSLIGVLLLFGRGAEMKILRNDGEGWISMFINRCHSLTQQCMIPVNLFGRSCVPPEPGCMDKTRIGKNHGEIQHCLDMDMRKWINLQWQIGVWDECYFYS